MRITFRNSRFEAIASYQEKDALKSAGFRWDAESRCWFTALTDIAAQFRDVADETAVQEMDMVSEKIERSKSAQIDASVQIPAPSGRSYFPYQHAGIAFASQRPATLIGDEMGLGKTIQAVGVINVTQPEKVLIICPATLKLNWRKELERWLVKPHRIHVLNSGDTFPRNVEIVVMNYDIAAKYQKDLRAIEWDLLVADEAHYMKNPKAQRTIAILGSGKKMPGIAAKRKILMTGTPITNRPIEIFPLVSVLWPSVFNNLFQFARRYCDAVSNGFGWDFSGASNLEELQNLLRASGMIRRLKADVLKELPPKTRQVVVLPSDSVRSLIRKEAEQSERHKEQIQRLSAAVKAAKAQNDEAAYKNAVGRLRQANNVAFTEMAAIRRELAIAKIPFVIEYVQNMIEAGEKVVVMAHHREVVDQIQAAFGLAAVKLYGGMGEGEKSANVERFQSDPACLIFIGSIHAAGVGITLTAAQKMLFAELDWTPANMLQAEDRIHRIGQQGNALIRQLVFDGSLDAKMADTLVRKMEVIERALDRVTEDEPIDIFETEYA